VRARLAAREHLLEVVTQQLPLEEVVRAAVLAGDDDALDPLRREDGAHRGEVVEVGLDVATLLGGDLEGLAGVGIHLELHVDLLVVV